MSSSSVENGLIKRIHHSAILVDGKKFFGEYDALVETGSNTSLHTFNPGKVDKVILIAAMERPERLKETVARILSSVKDSKVSTRILVMDNSIRPSLKDDVFDWVTSGANTAIESVVYYHNPRMTQATGRNIAFRNLIDDAQDIVLWDGDIYCGTDCLGKLNDIQKQKPNLSAIAPALVGYISGNIDERISEFSDIETNSNTRGKTYMPGKIGEQIWVREGKLMRATMMRGAFSVKRSLVEAVAASNSTKDPWLQDFVSLNNVAFFIAARELGYDFAYLLDPSAIVAHDDNVDEYSVGFRLPMRERQTLMEITALMVRNRVFTETGRQTNPRFLKFNLSEISRSTEVNEETASIIQEYLLKFAAFIDKSKDKNELNLEYREMRPTIPHTILKALDGVITRICLDNSLLRIKALKSIKPSRMMYSVED